MSPLAIAPDAVGEPPQYSSTLASLPISFSPASGEQRPEVLAIAGNGDWAARAAAAIGDGIRSIVVSAPATTSTSELAALIELASDRSARVELAEPYAGDPVFEKHGDQLRAHVQTLSALVVTESAPRLDQPDAVLRVLRTLRALGLEPELASVDGSPTGASIQAAAGRLIVEANVARSAAAVGQRIQGLGFSRTLDIRLHGAQNARPATVVVATMAGENRLSTVYETAERAAWRRIAADSGGGEPRNTGLRTFLEDLEAVQRL